MSEALSLTDQAYETVLMIDESPDYRSEELATSQEEEPWGTELMLYVLANQHEIAPCPWMGGQEVTLGEAMWAYNYPPNMTEKDVPAVWADVEDFLARRVVKEKKDTETEEKLQELTEEKSQQQPDQEKMPIQKIETKTELSRTKTETVERDNKSIEKPLAIQPANESINQAPGPIPAVSKPIKSEASADIAVPVIDQASLSMAETPFTADVFEIDDLKNDLKSEFALEVIPLPVPLFMAESQPVEFALEIPLQQYETHVDELVENVVCALDQTNKGIVSEPEAAEPSMIIGLDEQLSQIDWPIESIESRLIEVCEKAEADPLQMTETASQILEQIAELPPNLENEGGDLAEAEVQAELEELFVALFEQLQIDYSPAIIESLARLTIHWRFAEEPHIQQADGATDETAHDYGTHEIIKKLVAGLKTVKKIILNASAIGKSALQAYTYDFPTELRKRLAAA